MKWTKDNIIGLLVLLFVVTVPFLMGTEGNHGQIWEDVAVVATLSYAIILYVSGFLGNLKNLVLVG